jgi:hypothetical protein
VRHHPVSSLLTPHPVITESRISVSPFYLRHYDLTGAVFEHWPQPVKLRSAEPLWNPDAHPLEFGHMLEKAAGERVGRIAIAGIPTPFRIVNESPFAARPRERYAAAATPVLRALRGAGGFLPRGT